MHSTTGAASCFSQRAYRKRANCASTMSLQFAGQSVFQALGDAKHAIFFSLLRKVIIVVPLTLLLPRWFEVNGVFLAEPISNLIGGLASYITMRRTVYKQIEKAGRLCYKSEDKICEGSAEKMVENLMKRGHGSPLEHGTVYLTFKWWQIGKKLK